ncbi:hypothetical protein F5B22DRAFT_601374 [Xylaria bambusicola]|uniref:uncharacterized protein n=1 Tax=Xylaria bambusicola TaxID=326684 RepID=UPI00200852F0|nr:uncharacterized protein F5B22DRAFT_601374 [Xylaria bambusicola]KAI0518007.1 hypothetical protein F5B22DRAFT_601374 [Xylaria bambusicola]
MTSTSSVVNTVSLLSMPPEIRSAVYELVISNEWGHTSQEYFVLDRPLPALFRVNKQIRSEALDVFLLKNHFHVYTSTVGLKWLNILGKDVERFRYLILFIDLNLDAWNMYLKALLPRISEYLELRIRKAAVSLPASRLETFLVAAGLYDDQRWARTENGVGEIIFKQILA